MVQEIVDLKTIASRLGYSVTYMRNFWPQLLTGIKPLKIGAGRSIRFYWNDIQKLLEQPK